MRHLWETVSKALHENIGIAPETLSRICWTISLIVGYAILSTILCRLVRRRLKDTAKKYLATKTISFSLGAICFIAVLLVWFAGVTGLATYLGLLSAGIAIALQDPLKNLVGWLSIMVRKPFVLGDRIQIGEHSGDVIDISLFHFSLVEIGKWVDAEQSTGRIIHVPNGWLFQYPTANYTQGFNFVWDEIPVTVTFESDWQRAKGILTRIANEQSAIPSGHAADQIRKATRRFLIYYERLTPVVWTTVCDFGVTLTMRYLCGPRQRRVLKEKLWEQVLTEFAKEQHIDFAYPTRRIFDNVTEGEKPVPPRSPEPAATDTPQP